MMAKAKSTKPMTQKQSGMMMNQKQMNAMMGAAKPAKKASKKK
jgi:hypothetical protein